MKEKLTKKQKCERFERYRKNNSWGPQRCDLSTTKVSEKLLDLWKTEVMKRKTGLRLI